MIRAYNDHLHQKTRRPVAMAEVSQKVKDTALEEVNRVAALAKEAGASQAYIYPIKVGMLGTRQK